jgi:hypothetical protein
LKPRVVSSPSIETSKPSKSSIAQSHILNLLSDWNISRLQSNQLDRPTIDQVFTITEFMDSVSLVCRQFALSHSFISFLEMRSLVAKQLTDQADAPDLLPHGAWDHHGDSATRSWA